LSLKIWRYLSLKGIIVIAEGGVGGMLDGLLIIGVIGRVGI
jgi:hypothetical protein